MNTVRRVSGLTLESSPTKFLLGYSSTETVMLDMDDTSLDFVKFWARKVMRFFKLQGFLILSSSSHCFHVVFNRTVSWRENMQIVAWTALRCHNEGLRRWQLMQCRKGSNTLRVGPKGRKPSPKIVYKEGRQDKEIKNYYEFREMISKLIKVLNS